MPHFLHTMRLDAHAGVEPTGSVTRPGRILQSLWCFLAVCVTQFASASGPNELDLAADSWQWCDSLQFRERSPEASCADIMGQWKRCRTPGQPCSRHEISRLLVLATRLDDPSRDAISAWVEDRLISDALEFHDSKRLGEDALYGLSGQIGAFVDASGVAGEFISLRDRSMVSIARGRCSRDSLDAVFSDPKKPTSCFLLRSPLATRSMAHAEFRSALVDDVMRDLASPSATRSTCAANLVHRHWRGLDPAQRTRLLDWLESALPAADPVTSKSTTATWTGAMQIAAYWPDVVSRPGITSKLIALALRQNQAPRTQAVVRIPYDLGLVTRPLPLLVDDQQPTLDEIVVLGGPDPDEARRQLLADRGWLSIATRFDDLDLTRWLAADDTALPPQSFADNAALGTNPTLALRVLRRSGASAGIAIDRERLTNLQRTTLASSDVDDPDLHAEMTDAFRSALQDRDHWHQSATLWNLLIACGVPTRSMTETPIDVRVLASAHAKDLDTCTWFQSLPIDMRNEIIPPVE